jgi:hypothetical protein
MGGLDRSRSSTTGSGVRTGRRWPSTAPSPATSRSRVTTAAGLVPVVTSHASSSSCRPLAFSTLLALPSPPTLEGTDDPIRATRERTPTLNTLTHRTRMLFTVGSPTFGVHAFTVPIEPVPRRLTMTFPATRTDSEVHPPIPREILERKPFAAPRTPPLRDRLNDGHFFCDTLPCGSFFRGKLRGGLWDSTFSTTRRPPGPCLIRRERGRASRSGLQTHA